MKIIGITGKSGAGKTTLSGLLASDEGTRIIHMDYILEPIKEKRIFRNVTQNINLQQDENNVHRIIKPKLTDLLYNIKFIMKLYTMVRKIIINRTLNKEIEKAESEKVRMLIIDGIDLGRLDVFNKMDMLIMVKVPYHIRLERSYNRDGPINKSLVVKRDKRQQQNRTGKLNRKIDLLVENNGGIDELQEKAKDILKTIEEKDISPEKRFRKRVHKSNFVQSIIQKKKGTEIRHVQKFPENR